MITGGGRGITNSDSAQNENSAYDQRNKGMIDSIEIKMEEWQERWIWLFSEFKWKISKPANFRHNQKSSNFHTSSAFFKQAFSLFTGQKSAFLMRRLGDEWLILLTIPPPTPYIPLHPTTGSSNIV